MANIRKYKTTTAYQLTNLPTYQLTNLPAYQLTNPPVRGICGPEQIVIPFA
ncbi:MAG: hypothetical protein WCP32_07265 [Bacteroidota bacterium]